MVGFGLDYACAHINIPASVNLLPIQADFVTERDIFSLEFSLEENKFAISFTPMTLSTIGT